MEDIIKQAVTQAGAVLRLLPNGNDERKAWLVEYDRDTRLCFCVDNNPGDYDYVSEAWSSDSLCFLVFVDDKVKVYSLVEENPSVYDASLLVSNFEDFIRYVKRFFVKDTANIYKYFKRLYTDIVNARSVSNYTNLTSAEILCGIFYGDVENDFPEVLSNIAKGSKEGIVYNKKLLRPNIGIVCDCILPRFLDLLVLLESMSPNEEEANRKLQDAPYRIIDSFFIPEMAASHLANIVLQACKKRESYRIFDTFVWGTSVLLKIIKRIRSKAPDAGIYIKGYSISNYSDKIINSIFGRYNVSIEIEDEISLLSGQNPWLSDSDIVICLSPYRTMTKFVGRQEIPIDENHIFTVENFPFVMMRRCIEILSETGVCLINMPLHSLKDERYKSDRQDIDSIACIRRIESLGSYVSKETYGPICCMIATHKTNSADHLIYRWNEDKEYGFEESLRENIKSKARMISLNDDILYYRVPIAEVDYNDWSPKPFSDSSIIRNMRDGLSRNEIPIVCAERIFNINSGVRTGYTRAFTIQHVDYLALKSNQKTYFAPVVDRLALHDGQLHAENYIFYPYSGNTKRIESEDELRKILPSYYAYLNECRPMIERYRSARLKSNWWELVYRNSSHDPGTPKIVSLAYGSKGAFAFDAFGDFVVTGASQWTIKNQKKTDDNIIFAYLAIFNSDYFWKLIDVYAEKVNTGLSPKWKLNVKMLMSLPIPDLIECREAVDVLAAMGRNVHAFGCSAAKPELEDIVTRLYNGTYRY